MGTIPQERLPYGQQHKYEDGNVKGATSWLLSMNSLACAGWLLQPACGLCWLAVAAGLHRQHGSNIPVQAVDVGQRRWPSANLGLVRAHGELEDVVKINSHAHHIALHDLPVH